MNMVKKIGMVIVGATLVVAPCLIGGMAFADSYTQDGKPCPPECVSDSMEIITYYPSPYGYYEELRGDKIIVGDTDNSHIDETHLPPSGTITFEPMLDDPDASDGNLYEGSLYYQGAIGGTKGKFRFYDGSDWQDVGGGSDSVLPNFTSSNKPACNTSILGKMIYITDKDGAYLCGATDWKPMSGYSYSTDYTNLGTYSFTVPDNIYDVEIEIWSGGGGGGGGGSCGSSGTIGGSGGNSSVGSLIIAYGGRGGGGGEGGGGEWGPYPGGAGSGGLGGTSNGRLNISGKQGTTGGGGGSSGYNNTSNPNLGRGGGGGPQGYPQSGPGGGGGGGGYGRQGFSVLPSTMLTVEVGGGGYPGGAGGGNNSSCSRCCGGSNGTAGNPGRVIIRY